MTVGADAHIGPYPETIRRADVGIGPYEGFRKTPIYLIATVHSSPETRY